MKLTSEPGLIVSGLAHAALLVAVLVAFSGAKKFVDAQEAIPVEMLTQAEFNEITKGEKTAKEVKPTPQKAEKVAALPTPKPIPVPEALADLPVPPPPLRRAPDPVAEDVPATKPVPPKPAPTKAEPVKPEPVRIVQPPPRPHSAPVPVAQTPPPAPVPPARPEPAKPAPPKVEAKVEPPPNPDDAEVVVPKPRPVPKVEPPKPVVAVVPPPVAPVVPPKKIRPMERPHTVAPADPARLDEIARQLAQKPAPTQPDVPTPAPKAPPEPVAPKVAAAVTPAPVPQRVYDPDSIAKLLNKDKPQQTAAAAPEVARTGSIGAPTQSAAKMSPSQTAALDGLMMDQYNQCWPDNGMDGHGYVPQIRVQFGPDGALLGQPVLVNPPADPTLHSLAADALRAVRKCNPLKIPAQYAPFYEQWKQRLLRFDPAERTG